MIELYCFISQFNYYEKYKDMALYTVHDINNMP